ncbi:hypothetical protein [Lewinella cohaerens]|uniref:hypothetical protein n=1 Tax=Lewinella cohaerens TaxID=70995 RepID=UPI0003794DBD|nr:hypothetical protein [Lewinella cohaerens]
MKTAQFYKYATWLLLSLNLLLVAFFFLGRPGPPNGPGRQNFREEAVSVLQLSSEQEAAFVESAMKHSEAMTKLGKQEDSMLKNYFEPLLGYPKSEDPDSLMAEILGIERAKIEGTFQHFAEVKALLDDSQGANFDEFMRRALRMLLLDEQQKAPPPKD